MGNLPDNPMNRAPRCLAKTRKGTACLCPAIRGKKRCKLHGGRSTGPPKGNRNAWKHGGRSAETQAFRALLRAMRDDLAGIEV